MLPSIRFTRSKRAQESQWKWTRRSRNKLFRSFRILWELHRAGDPLAFLDENYLVHLHIFQGIELSTGPTNLEHVNFASLSQSEVNAQIVLREVPSTAAYLVDLPVRLCFSGQMSYAGQARANAAAI